MKTYPLWIVSFLTTVVISCGDSGDSVRNQLTARSSFTVRNASSLTSDCGQTNATRPVQNAPDTNSSAGTSAALVNLNITLSFSETEFNVRVNGETVLSGAWRLVDDNTIEFTVDGESMQFSIDIDDDEVNLSPSGVAASESLCTAVSTPMNPPTSQEEEMPEPNESLTGSQQ